MTTTNNSTTAAQAAPQTENQIFTYREAANQAELEQLFRLRYACFTQGVWEKHSLISRNPYRMDIDVFDLKSTHNGVFIQQDGKEIAVAYTRFVGKTKNKQSDWVKNILAKCPKLKVEKSNADFPFQEKLSAKGKKIAEHFLQQNKTFKTVEVSRACVAPDFPNAALCDFLMISNSVFGVGLNFDTNFIFIVKKGTERIFTRSGAKPIEGLSTQVFDMQFDAYFMNHGMISTNKSSKINSMSSLFLQNKCIRLDTKQNLVF
jgi:Acetyltransferase (GNAT) domain